MKNIQDRAQNLFNKACRDGKIAVFYTKGEFKSTKAQGGIAKEAEDRKMLLMGIYDKNCDLSWLEEDMEYMVKNYGGDDIK